MMFPVKRLIQSMLLLTLLSVSFSQSTDNTSWKVLLLQVFDIVQNNYVEKNVDTNELVYGSIKGMLKSLDDPYTRFLEPKNYKEMKISLKGNFYGVGIHIGLKKHQLTVISPILDTPADKAGIHSLDKIVEIDGESTEGISLEEAVSKIRGPKGTTVTLGVRREGVDEVIQIPIVRDKIKLKNVDKIEMLTDDIGYFRLITFESKNAKEEVLKAIKRLEKKGMTKLIFDLRNNGGGLLSNAVSITSLFLEKGTVVFTVDRNANRTGLPVQRRRKIFDGELVLLVNGASASASEIVAGAIQDYERGTIIGTRTFGKASVQNIVPLKGGSAILLTVAKYYTPLGQSIHGSGLTPNIEARFPTSDIESMREGTFEYSIETDVQIQEAIKFLNH
jgi:carboxyl-terminal processing protease